MSDTTRVSVKSTPDNTHEKTVITTSLYYNVCIGTFKHIKHGISLDPTSDFLYDEIFRTFKADKKYTPERVIKTTINKDKSIKYCPKNTTENWTLTFEKKYNAEPEIHMTLYQLSDMPKLMSIICRALEFVNYSPVSCAIKSLMVYYECQPRIYTINNQDRVNSQFLFEDFFANKTQDTQLILNQINGKNNSASIRSKTTCTFHGIELDTFTMASCACYFRFHVHVESYNDYEAIHGFISRQMEKFKTLIIDYIGTR